MQSERAEKRAMCASLRRRRARDMRAGEWNFQIGKKQKQKTPRRARFFICRREEQNVPLWSICADNRLRYRTPTGLTFLFLYRRVRVSIANSFCEGEYKCASTFFIIFFCSPSPISLFCLCLSLFLDGDFGLYARMDMYTWYFQYNKLNRSRVLIIIIMMMMMISHK